MEAAKKVTKNDILQIKAGTSKTFNLISYEACRSAATYVYIINHSSFKPATVERYKIKMDAKEHTIIIEALARI